MSLSLLDYSIILAFIPVVLFSLALCSILSEVVGISFEQAKFIVEDQLPISTVIKVHWLKLPAFISFSFPFALLIASATLYTKLSHQKEIIALQSFGVSLYRLIVPAMAIAFCSAIIMVTLQELVVPEANYQAAIILEQQWDVDRSQLSKYNKREIIYQEFAANSQEKHLKAKYVPAKSLKLLFFAQSFDGQRMRDIILTRYNAQKITQIVVADSAEWDESQGKWRFFGGKLYELNIQGDYGKINNFEQLSLKLTKNIFDYANHQRDNREISLVDLYRRLEILQHTNNVHKVQELQINIQERYAAVASCFMFTFLGSVCGIGSRTKTGNGSLGIAAIAIIIYFSIQLISTALAASQIISVFAGVWFPNLLGFVTGCLILHQD